jgi:hypothetical protein
MIPKPLEKLLMNRRHLDWTGFFVSGSAKGGAGNKNRAQLLGPGD